MKTRLAIALLVLVVPASCFSAEGEMRYGMHVTLPAKWLDPGDMEGFSTPYMIVYAIHDAMVKPMPAGMQTPSLAESWSEAKDHLSYTFTLRKNAKFHDGSPVTPEDVKFSFERYKGTSATLLKEKMKEVQVVARGRGPVQGRVVHARRGDRARGLRRLLAQDAQRQADRHALDDGGDDARGRAEA